jgi:hypothetical protein
MISNVTRKVMVDWLITVRLCVCVCECVRLLIASLSVNYP